MKKFGLSVAVTATSFLLAACGGSGEHQGAAGNGGAMPVEQGSGGVSVGGASAGGASPAADGGTGAASTSSGGHGQGCVPGQSVACVGPGACTGSQVCSADGESFGTCFCAVSVGAGGAIGAGGASTALGSGGAGGAPQSGPGWWCQHIPDPLPSCTCEALNFKDPPTNTFNRTPCEQGAFDCCRTIPGNGGPDQCACMRTQDYGGMACESFITGAGQRVGSCP